MNKGIKDLDVVALLGDIPSEHLERGEVGTVVFDFGDGVFLIEFSGRFGQTYKLTELRAEQLLPLHHNEHAKMAA